jgi:hypothetical protein
LVSPAAPAPSVRLRPDAAATDAIGRLLIRSTPADAQVFVDGREIGRTPTTVRDLARGPHRVRVTREGYAALERRVVITTKRPAQSMLLTLPRAPAARVSVPDPLPPAAIGQGVGGLSVESKPTGAKVFVDGRPVGTTPILLASVPAGLHTIRIVREGSRTWSKSFEVIANERNRVTASLER